MWGYETFMLAYVPQDATVLSKITKYEGFENWEFVKNRPSARFFFAFSLFICIYEKNVVNLQPIYGYTDKYQTAGDGMLSLGGYGQDLHAGGILYRSVTVGGGLSLDTGYHVY